jgi:MoaA/NifB/PqqE/SkfB family radical SAM enzyme
MSAFVDYVKSRLLVIYLMLKGSTFPRLLNLLVSFYSMVLKRPTSGRMPPQLIIKLTSRCNYSCIMCPKMSPDLGYYDNPSDLPYPILERLLRENAKHLSLVKLYGGEPLYHRDIVRILDLLNELKLKFTITTNGYLLTSEVCRRLTRNCVRVFISIDSANPEVYSTIRRGGDLERIVNNVQQLQQTIRQSGSSGPIIKAIMTVFAFNLSEMAGMVEFCAARGIRYLVFQEGVPYGNAAVRKEHLLRTNIACTESIIRQTRTIGERRDVVLEFDFPWLRQSRLATSFSGNDAMRAVNRKSFRCFYLYFTMLIQQDNECAFCFGTYDHLNAIDDRHLSEIWNGREGPYYHARVQLKNGVVPADCGSAYAAGGKCALTMVRS